LEEAKRFGRPLTLLMADIDDFKRVNDTFGHQVGDHALKAFARLLTTLSRQTDYVARYGGEEFMVILVGTNKEKAEAVAERIRKGVAGRHFEPNGMEEEIRLTVSIGMAGYPEDAEEPKELIGKADRALYAAKAAGKNCVKAF
jgi:diguanylate cyclase (GGDEF)-like protein